MDDGIRKICDCASSLKKKLSLLLNSVAGLEIKFKHCHKVPPPKNTFNFQSTEKTEGMQRDRFLAGVIAEGDPFFFSLSVHAGQSRLQSQNASVFLWYKSLDNSNIDPSRCMNMWHLGSQNYCSRIPRPEATGFFYSSVLEWQIKPRPFLFSAVCIALAQIAGMQVCPDSWAG